MDLENKKMKIAANGNPDVKLSIIPGHFSTNHSHINYFIDITNLKARQNDAKGLAKAMVDKYVLGTVVDTIVCMDGCEAIGAYLAEELTDKGFHTMNYHKTIYITTPEFSNGQMIFRDNTQHMIRDKNVVLLVASASTGLTIQRCIACIQYYGGILQGISAIFSNEKTIDSIPVDAVFTHDDIPDYRTYDYSECPYCKAGTPLDAIVNGYGYSVLKKG